MHSDSGNLIKMKGIWSFTTVVNKRITLFV